MTRRILVVEDDPHFRRQLSDYFEYMGWSARLAASGSDGVELFRQLPADLVLCDVMLPGMDGFETITEIRDLPGGADATVIMVSAVWNEPGRFEDRLRRIGATEFHRKPLSIVDLGRRISALLDEPDRFLGDAAATRSGQWRSDELDLVIKEQRKPLPSLGSFGSIQLVDLLVRVFREARSGVLSLNTSEAKRRLWLLDGYVVRARSDLPAESLVSVLVAEGLLPPERVPGLLFAARKTGSSLAELAVQSGQVDARAVLNADRVRTRRVLLGALASDDGVYELQEGQSFAGRTRLVEVHPLPVLWDAVQKIPLKDLGEEMARRSEHLVVRGGEFDRLHSELSLPATLDWLGSSLSEGIQLSTLLERQRGHPGLVIRALWLMVRLGIADTVSERRTANPDQIGPKSTTRPPSLTFRNRRDETPLDDRSSALMAEYVSLAQGDHYRLMGVSEDASTEEIDKAWRLRASEWRPVAIDNEVPPEVRTKARELLSRLATAHEALADREVREAYDAERLASQIAERQGTALERLREARLAVTGGRWAEAEGLLRTLLEEYPTSVEILASLAWSIFRGKRRDKEERIREAVELLCRAREVDGSHDRVLRYLSVIYGAAGQTDLSRAAREQLDALTGPDTWPAVTSTEFSLA
jgi:DNA-binding response OmpR family regulator/curved DNA-binding protein CbpA